MNEYTPEMARAAVERGAAWMDKHCPDWFSHINIDRLDLGHPTFCVLGQTAKCLLSKPRPDTAMRDGYYIVLNEFGHRAFGTWSKNHGFVATRGVEYEVLTLTWREYIRERLAVPA